MCRVCEREGKRERERRRERGRERERERERAGGDNSEFSYLPRYEADALHKLLRRLAIETRGRLIHDEHSRARYERQSHRDASPLAAAELARACLESVRDAQVAAELVSKLPPLTLCRLAVLKLFPRAWREGIERSGVASKRVRVNEVSL